MKVQFIFCFSIFTTLLSYGQEITVTEIPDKKDQHIILNDFLNDSYTECDSAVATYRRVIHANLHNDGGTIFIYTLANVPVSEKSYSSIKDYKKNGSYKTFHDNGQLEKTFTYIEDTLQGPFFHYFENGQLRIKGFYNKNELQDTLKSYYSNQKLRRIDHYDTGQLLKGQCFSSTGTDTTYFPFDKDPSFYGKEDSLQKWIMHNVIYPTDAIEMNEQGRVYVSFIIEKDGSVSTIQIERGVSQSLDNEVRRLIKAMPVWTPGEYDGYLVRTKMRLPVNFTLEGGGLFSGSSQKKRWWKRN